MEETDETKGYNGWINYETWLVSLWLDNQQATYFYWLEQVARCQREAANASPVQRGIGTAEQEARCNLANQLKEEVTNASPLREASLYADLLGAALSEVDWLEIVDHWLSE